MTKDQTGHQAAFSGRPLPVYSAAIAVLCLSLKLFQWGSIEPQLAMSFYLHWLGRLGQDVGLCLLVWLLADQGLWFGRVRGRWLLWLGKFFYLALILYLFLMFKFYALFRTFLTFNLLLQVEGVESYLHSVMQELDAVTGGLVLAGVLFTGLVFWLRRRLGGLETGLQLERIKAYRRLSPDAGKSWGLLAGVILYAAVISPWQRAQTSHQDFFELDVNPVVQLAVSCIQGIWPESKISHARRLKSFQPATKKPEGQAAIALKPLPLAIRQQMNVVIILLESMTPEYTGLARPEMARYTPQLTRLAEKSCVLMNHYCQEPATLKSLYSILSGRYSFQTRRWNQFIERVKTDPTLPELLAARGYHSIFITSADGRIYSQNQFLQGRFNTVVDMNVLLKKSSGYSKVADALDDRILVGEFEHYLKTHQQQKYFVMLSPYSPHHPYLVPGPEFERIKGEQPFEHYKNALAFLDSVVGDLYRVMEKYHQVENTLLVVVSDHGEAFRQHPGNYLHSIYLYEENIHTVCMFSNPRLIPTMRVTAPTRHIDLAPTILAMLGYPGLTSDGVSVLDPREEPDLFFYTRFSHRRVGMRHGDWKYILDLSYASEELFDLRKDPQERFNLAPRQAIVCRELQRQVRKFEESLQ